VNHVSLGTENLHPQIVVVVIEQRDHSLHHRVVRHLQNLGYGRSLKDGIDAARYDAIAITDASKMGHMTQPPALIISNTRLCAPV
jgi:hypothetical protein